MEFRLLENVKGEFISKDEKQNKNILTKLSGNDITVFMAKDKNGGTKVQRVQGKKNTIITREGQNIKSDNIDYNSLTGKVVASKNNKIYVENTQDKTTVLSEKIEGNLNEEKLYFKAKTTIESYNEKNEKTTLVGNSGVVDNKQETVELKENVKMENNQFIFSADRIIYNKKTQKVKAFGNTKIGVVDNKQETVELKENVKMENNQFIFSADRIIYNKKTQKVKAFGNTKIDYKIK